MRLKKLEITGFKSFCETTSIQFPSGVSAIVGPNGCGKSNVMDALRWVMGEQSVKQLRGKSMEDVIFSGANGHPPLNLAEVNLILANNNGSAPEALKEYSEIMLTRRLYRSGESGYLINKQPCRLKDIYNVFLGSGMGTRSYSVIQQGNIGAITEAGPEELRHFIEEAAGTTRYKARKIEALRKVKATNRNLLRVDDIILEISRQKASLKHQAQKAKRYKTYQEAARYIDVRLSLVRYDRIEARHRKFSRVLERLQSTRASRTARLQKVDAILEEIQLKRRQKHEEIAIERRRLSDLERSANNLENDRKHRKETVLRLQDEVSELTLSRSTVTTKIKAVTAEIEKNRENAKEAETQIKSVRQALKENNRSADECKNRRDELTRNLEGAKAALMDLTTRKARQSNFYQNASDNKARLKMRLRQKEEEACVAQKNAVQYQKERTKAAGRLEAVVQALEQYADQLEKLRKTLDVNRHALGRQVKTVQTLIHERTGITARYTTLKKMEENFEWYKDGVKTILSVCRLKNKQNGMAGSAVVKEKVLGLLADVIRVEPGYETAVEAALGDALQYLLVKDADGGRAAVELLKAKGKGRSGFIPVEAVDQYGAVKEHREDHPQALLKYLTVEPAYTKTAQALLGKVVFCEELAAAQLFWARSGGNKAIVTRAGDLITPEGIMIGGGRALDGILTKKRKLRGLSRRLKALDVKIKAAQKVQQELETELRQSEAELQQVTVSKNGRLEEKAAVEKTVIRKKEALRHARQQMDVIRFEKEQMIEEGADLDKAMARHEKEMTELGNKIRNARKSVDRLVLEIAGVAEQTETCSRRREELNLHLTRLTTELENQQGTIRRLASFCKDDEERLAQIGRDVEDKKRLIATSTERIEAEMVQLKERYRVVKKMNQKITADEKSYHAFGNTIDENRGALTKLRKEQAVVQKKGQAVEIELSGLNVKKEHLENRLLERYHKLLPTLRQQQKARQEDPYAFMSEEALKEALDQQRHRLHRLGSVHLGAIEEFNVLEERFDFLNRQRGDLAEAVAGLHRVIRKINRITSERFTRTLEAVNGQLEGVFPQLFEGGKARLVMTDPGKPLDSGVEYMIQPPGKKLTRISLLSGGEKALAAIAFIFSIFLIRPASFCLLDEIDAPLDDANILRFNDLLKVIGEKSQIVMITHNKRSMEFADILFGITMEKKGISKVVTVDFQQAESPHKIVVA